VERRTGTVSPALGVVTRHLTPIRLSYSHCTVKYSVSLCETTFAGARTGRPGAIPTVRDG